MTTECTGASGTARDLLRDIAEVEPQLRAFWQPLSAQHGVITITANYGPPITIRAADLLAASAREIERLKRERDEAAAQAYAHIRAELFSLCEDTEDKYAAQAVHDLEGKEGAFARGRVIEAKSIRKAMGEVFYLATRARAALAPAGDTPPSRPDQA